MEKIHVADCDGLTAWIMQDEDPFPPDELGDDVKSGVFIATTRNRYFERNPEYLNAPPDGEWYEFPLYAYVHSGIALSLGRSYPFDCPWDSGQIGVVRVLKCEHWPDVDAAFKVAEGAVESWNQYLSGDVWGVIIARTDDPDDQVDSCWGFYGEDYAKEEAAGMLAAAVENEREENEKIARAWAC